MLKNREIVETDNVLVREMVLEKDASAEWHHHSEVSDYFVCLTEKCPGGNSKSRPSLLAASR
jgi:hypothetical protein